MKSKPIARFDLQYVGENLYRNKSSGVYYALFKRDRKQIRKFLKTGRQGNGPSVTVATCEDKSND